MILNDPSLRICNLEEPNAWCWMPRHVGEQAALEDAKVAYRAKSKAPSCCHEGRGWYGQMRP